MSIEKILQELQNILPAENFKSQPSAAKEELLALEKKYQLNTSEVLTNKKPQLSEEALEAWINTLETFTTFGGTMDDLNHITEGSFINYNESDFMAPYMNNTKNDYIKKDDKESFDKGFLVICFIQEFY